MIRKPILVSLGVGTALLLAGCGASNGAGAADQGSGLTEVTVGVLPVADTAAIYLGKEAGFFEEEGLDLQLEVTAGGAAAVPGVVSESFDFAYSNIVSVMVAQDKGLDLQFVSNGVNVTADPDSGISALVVPEGSDISSMADLEGKTVSVNTLSNMGDIAIKKLVEDAGADPAAVDFVEVGFPDAPAAIANGQVDASWIVEPFITQAVEEDAKVVSWILKEVHPELSAAGYFTTSKKIESDPELVEGFASAMDKSLEYAEANPDEVRRILGTYTSISDDLRSKMTLPRFQPGFNKEAVQLFGDAAVKYGTLSKAPDLDRMLP